MRRDGASVSHGLESPLKFNFVDLLYLVLTFCMNSTRGRGVHELHANKASPPPPPPPPRWIRALVRGEIVIKILVCTFHGSLSNVLSYINNTKR